jgi:hypothetical protein
MEAPIPSPVYSEMKMQDLIEVKKLVVTESITVMHPEAPHGLTITADPTGAGIWIGNKTFVAIHNIAGQCCLALASKKDKNGHAFAISIDEAGEPSIQFVRPGHDPIIITGERLTKLLA